VQPIRVPDEAKVRLAPCRLVRWGPPEGVSDEDCGTVEMLASTSTRSTYGTISHFAFFKPTADELKALQDGAVLELCQIGAAVQPFALNVVAGGQ
jgi:hypothetical protein